MESEHAKSSKLKTLYIYCIRGKNAPKIVSIYLKDNMQNQTFSKLYNYDKKYASNPNNILKSAKKLLWKTLHQDITSKTVTSDLLIKIPNSKKSKIDWNFHNTL